MDLKKISAYILFTVMSSPLAVWASNQLIKVASNENKIKSLEEDMSDIKSDIKDIHWFLIKQNKIKVPNHASDK